jgi:RNA polymerase sigma factor (sigma-70 family)
MMKKHLGSALRRVRTLVAPEPTAEPGDGQLLERFAAQRDEAAFAALVQRHGGLVLRTCRHLLRHQEDAEDAFQACFLVLARKAASLRGVASVAGWLHGVACRTALNARRSEMRRRKHSTPPQRQAVQSPAAEASLREVQAVLDEEVARLPQKYRAAFVLCCLEGKGRGEAARALGWKEGTVSSRLDQARKRLRRGLARRGVTLSAALTAAGLAAPCGEAAFSAVTAVATARAALGFPTASARAGQWAGEVIRQMGRAKLHGWAAVVLALGAVVGGAGVVAQREGGGRPGPAGDPPPAQKTGGETPLRVRTDRYGDPLPAGAVARLGTVRFRHGNETVGVAFSPDGKTLAVRSFESILFFDAATGRQSGAVTARLTTMMGKTFAFAPDGKTVAFVNGHGSVAVWDVAAKKQLRRIAFPSPGATQTGALCFSPGGALLASCSGGGTASLLDVAGGKTLRTLGAPRGETTSLAFSPDGRTLAVGTLAVVQLWDVAGGKLVREAEIHKDRFVYALTFSPDGKVLAAGSWDRITLVDPATAKEVGRLEAAKAEAINDLTFSRDGKTLFAGSQDRKARVWDVEKKQPRLTLDTRLGPAVGLALSPDGKTIAIAGWFSAVRLWDVASGKELFTQFEGPDDRVDAIAFAPDGKTVVAANAKGPLRLWDVAGSRQTGELAGSGRAFSLTRDARLLAAVEGGNKVRGWDLVRRREVWCVESPGAGRLMQAALAPDGTVLATCHYTKPARPGLSRGSASLTTWDGATGRKLRPVALPDCIPRSVAVAPGGRLAAVGEDFHILLCDLEEGRVCRELNGNLSSTYCLAFTPDGRMLVSGGFDTTVRVWEVASGQQVLALRGHRRGIGAVAVSPDGRLIASSHISFWNYRIYPFADTPRQVRLWDACSGEPVGSLAGHTWDLTSLAFAPDGSRLATGVADGTVLVWDTGPALRAVRKGPRPLSAQQRAAGWDDLAGADAAQAYQAVGKLAHDPHGAVTLLHDRLRPTDGVEAGRLARLVANLDSESFEERQKAEKELEALSDVAAPALRAALAKKPSPEARRRCAGLLEKLGGPLPAGELLRAVRGVQVLEAVGTPEAAAVLERLAAGAAAARLTREARESLHRLDVRR